MALVILDLALSSPMFYAYYLVVLVCSLPLFTMNIISLFGSLTLIHGGLSELN